MATTGDRSAIRDLSKIALPTDLAISRNSPLSRLYQHLNEDAGKIKIEMMQAPSRDRSTWRPLAGTKVIVGTVMGFRVTSPVAGNLILLDRLPEGELQLITPEAVPVIAGQTITLPLDENSAVQVSPPLGQEALIAVVVPGDVKLKSLSALSEATESSQFSIFGATAFTDEIVGVLDQRQNLRNDFGFGFFSFEIRLA